MAGLKVDVSVKGKKFKSNFDLALGENGRFKLSGDFPEVGRAGLGRSSYSWIIGGEKSFLRNKLSSKLLVSKITGEGMSQLRI